MLRHPNPDLTDGCVTLRRWRYSDLGCVKSASDEGIIPESTTVPDRFTEEAGRAFIERQRGRAERGEGWSFAVSDSTTGEAVGCIVLMLRPQGGAAGVGYWLVPEMRGRRIAPRAISLLTEWGLGSGNLRRIEAWVEPGNDASIAVLSRCGYEYEGRLRSFLSFPKRRADALVFSRIRDDEVVRRK